MVAEAGTLCKHCSLLLFGFNFTVPHDIRHKSPSFLLHWHDLSPPPRLQIHSVNQRRNKKGKKEMQYELRSYEAVIKISINSSSHEYVCKKWDEPMKNYYLTLLFLSALRRFQPADCFGFTDSTVWFTRSAPWGWASINPVQRASKISANKVEHLGAANY